MNLAEVHAGMRPNEKEETEVFLSNLHCIPITADIGRLAGSLKNRFAREGKTLELPDMIVAAAALEHGLTLMMDNRRDFPIPDLKLYDLP